MVSQNSSSKNETNRKPHSIGSNYRKEHPVSTYQNHGPNISFLKNSQEKDAESMSWEPSTGQNNSSELPPIEVDVTSYGKKESFIHAYKRVSKEIEEDKRRAKNSISNGQEIAGFWESYLHGIGLVFKFMGKTILFFIYALTAMYFISKCF